MNKKPLDRVILILVSSIMTVLCVVSTLHGHYFLGLLSAIVAVGSWNEAIIP